MYHTESLEKRLEKNLKFDYSLYSLLYINLVKFESEIP